MELIEFLTNSAQGVSTMVVNVFTGLSRAFWVIGTEGQMSIQPLGQIALLAAVVGVVWKGFAILRSFIKLR